MKVRNSKGELKELVIKANDSIPAGTVIDFEGDVVPEGYEQVEDKGEVYSTEEQRIGTWIDGKPLYRKVGTIKFTSIYSQGNFTVGSLISSNIKYGTITKVFTDSLLCNNLYNTFDSTIKSNIYVSAEGGYIFGFTTRENYLNKTIYVVVEYTKTTD